MKKHLSILAVLFGLCLTAASSAQAADKPAGKAPNKNCRGEGGEAPNKNYKGEGDDLSVEITFLNPFGQTTADASGTHYSIPQMGLNITDPAQIYAPQIWGTYPLYLVGMPMNFNVTVTSKAEKNDKPFNVKVRASSYVLNMDGSAGTPLGTQEYIVENLQRGESRTLMYSVALTSTDLFKGLDVTDIQIFNIKKHENPQKPDEGLIFWQSAYWCPPDIQQLPDDIQQQLLDDMAE